MAATTPDMPGAYQPAPGFQGWWRRSSMTRTAYLYLLPAFLVMGFITFYPMLYQVWMSFTDYGVASINPNSPRYVAPKNVGVQNYADIFQGGLADKIQNFDFWNLLAFNLIWTLTNVPFHVIFGVLIAVLLNVQGLWFKKAYRAIYILPMVLPTLVVATIWKNMYDDKNGAINQILAMIGGWFGVPAENFQIRWFSQIDAPFFNDLQLPWGAVPTYAVIVVVLVAICFVLIRLKVPYGGLASLILITGGLAIGVVLLKLPLSYYAMLIANIWLGWPFMTIVATGALQSIPTDLYEAASIDGASPQQQFMNITVPLIRPAMVPAAMFGLITTFNLFNFIFFMSGGGPLRQTEILVTTAYSLVQSNQLYGMAAAFCVIIFFVLLGLTLLTNTVTKGTERYDDV